MFEWNKRPILENGSTNLGQTTRPSNKQQNKSIVGLAVPADHCVKLKESEKKKISTWTLLG